MISERIVDVGVSRSECCDGQQSVKIGGIIGPVQEGSGGLILCYAQALGVVRIGSWFRKVFA